MAEPLLDHARAFTERIARVVDGRAVEHGRLTGFLNSRFDRFLNQLFASETIAPREAVEALDGHPGFVWLTEEPAPDELPAPGAERLVSAVVHGMTATTAAPNAPRTVAANIANVSSHADLDAWHAVYCEVFGGDSRSRDEWRDVNDALGPGGEGSLVLLLARVEGSPAATGGVYFDSDWAGLYCFTTREQMRGRGLATALVHASHEAARARGIKRALLHATPMASPIYAGAGYQEARLLPLLVAS
jgi:GNAT superfamily N-acetyltransferase